MLPVNTVVKIYIQAANMYCIIGQPEYLLSGLELQKQI